MTSKRPEHCTAAVFRRAGMPLELQSFRLPIPVAGEALVQIQLCTICGSDLHTIKGDRIEPAPSILGHEILGSVVEVGNPPMLDIDGEPLKPGDRVTWSTCISCFQCEHCKSGLPQKCVRVAKYGHDVAEGRYPLSGGLAEYIVLRPGSSVVKLRPGLPDEVVCPVNCATATVAAACRAAGSLSGKQILIFGAGMLGLTLSAYARAAKARSIVVVDTDKTRALRTTQFGADDAVCWDPDADRDMSHRLADAVFECSGSPTAVELAIQSGKTGTQIVLVGSVRKSPCVALDPERIVRHCLTIKGVHNYARQDLRAAVEFLEQQHTSFPFGELVEQTFPLAEVNEAIQFALDHHPIRVAVRP